jgi:hypothetical protein
MILSASPISPHSARSWWTPLNTRHILHVKCPLPLHRRHNLIYIMVNYDRKPLDASLYSIDPRLARLLKASTGIHDDAQLKAHILRIQKEAYDVSTHSPVSLSQGAHYVPHSLSHTRAFDFSHSRRTLIFIIGYLTFAYTMVFCA